MPRGAQEVPAGEALGEPGVQRVREGCLLLPSLEGLRSHWDLHDWIIGLGTERTGGGWAQSWRGQAIGWLGANGGMAGLDRVVRRPGMASAGPSVAERARRVRGH